MAITRKKNIGLLLLEAGILEPEQLEQALLKQSKEYYQNEKVVADLGKKSRRKSYRIVN